MRRITSIEPQKKPGSHRVNLFLDGSFAFSLHEDLGARLVPGSFLSDAEISQYQRDDDVHQALDAALLLLTYRPRSASELRIRLLRRGFDPSLVDEAMERLRSMGAVDDAEFAQFWVENRQTYRPSGGRLLNAELRAKGIEQEIREAALPDDEQESEAAYRAAGRKLRALRGLPWQEFRQKLGSHLVRRGFGYDTASSVVRRVWQELNEAEPESLEDDPGPDPAE